MKTGRRQVEPQIQMPWEFTAVEAQGYGPLDPMWAASLLSPRPLSSYFLMALGTITWNGWVLLEVVQRPVSTYCETDDPDQASSQAPQWPQAQLSTCRGGGRAPPPEATRVLGPQTSPLACRAQLSDP